MRLQLSHLVRHLQGTWQSCSEDGEVVIRFCSSPMRLSKEGFIDTVAEDQRSASSGAMPRPRRSHEGLLGGLSSLGEPDVDSPACVGRRVRQLSSKHPTAQGGVSEEGSTRSRAMTAAQLGASPERSNTHEMQAPLDKVTSRDWPVENQQRAYRLTADASCTGEPSDGASTRIVVSPYGDSASARADTGGSADDERGFALTPLARADASPVQGHQPRLSNGTPLSRPGSPLSLDPVHLSPKAQRVSPGHSRRLIEGWPRIEQHLEPLRALPADTGKFSHNFFRPSPC